MGPGGLEPWTIYAPASLLPLPRLGVVMVCTPPPCGPVVGEARVSRSIHLTKIRPSSGTISRTRRAICWTTGVGDLSLRIKSCGIPGTLRNHFRLIVCVNCATGVSTAFHCSLCDLRTCALCRKDFHCDCSTRWLNLGSSLIRDVFPETEEFHCTNPTTPFGSELHREHKELLRTAPNQAVKNFQELKKTVREGHGSTGNGELDRILREETDPNVDYYVTWGNADDPIPSPEEQYQKSQRPHGLPVVRWAGLTRYGGNSRRVKRSRFCRSSGVSLLILPPRAAQETTPIRHRLTRRRWNSAFSIGARQSNSVLFSQLTSTRRVSSLRTTWRTLT